MGLKTRDKVIVAVLVVLAIVVFVLGRQHDNNTSFTTEKWVDYAGNSRQLMLQDLVDRTRFVGMTRAEVLELLGEAEEETDRFLTYYVGIPQGLFGTKPDADAQYLLITLDAEDIVDSSEVVTAAVLPKESQFRIIGDATEGTVVTPTEE